jgi:hypothetical protein
MNRLRHFQARGASGRWMLCLFFLALVSRLMIPPGLMFDADAGDGAYGLAICSGHGPLVLSPSVVNGRGLVPYSGAASGITKHAASIFNADHHASTAAGPAQPTHSATNEACPYSAVFTTALATVILFLVFSNCSTVVVARRPLQTLILIKRLLRSSQGARAPPVSA